MGEWERRQQLRPRNKYSPQSTGIRKSIRLRIDVWRRTSRSEVNDGSHSNKELSHSDGSHFPLGSFFLPRLLGKRKEKVGIYLRRRWSWKGRWKVKRPFLARYHFRSIESVRRRSTKGVRVGMECLKRHDDWLNDKGSVHNRMKWKRNVFHFPNNSAFEKFVACMCFYASFFSPSRKILFSLYKGDVERFFRGSDVVFRRLKRREKEVSRFGPKRRMEGTLTLH